MAPERVTLPTPTHLNPPVFEHKWERLHVKV